MLNLNTQIKIPMAKMSVSALSPVAPFFHYTSSSKLASRNVAARIHASALSQATKESSDVSCTFCKAKGWIVCDFCEGQKVNVQVKQNRMYRRCPSCKAAGVVLCPKCKVFKCVTFPDETDGGFEM